MQSERSADSPVFIIGMGRSGTTLMRLMLTAHPQFCIPPEGLLFITLEPKFGEVADLSDRVDEFLEDLYQIPLFLDWNVDRTRLQDALRQHQPLSYATAIATVYQTYMQQTDPDACCWGDKNPVHIYHITKIRQYFPNARFILMVRDVRAIYNSLNTNEKKFQNWRGSCRANVLSVTKQWQNVIQIQERHQHDPNFYTMIYETLVKQPEAELDKLCRWLNVEFSSSMLEFYSKNAQEGLVPEREMGWHSRTLQPVSRDRINSWEAELHPADLQALELLNGKNLHKLGYTCMTHPLRGQGWLKLLPDYLEHNYRRFKQVFLKPRLT